MLIRGTNTGIAWHASNPAGTDQYPDGTGFFCVIGACWTDATSLGPVDFMLTYAGRRRPHGLHAAGERRRAELADARERFQLQGPVRQDRHRPHGRRLQQERHCDGLHDRRPRRRSRRDDLDRAGERLLEGHAAPDPQGGHRRLRRPRGRPQRVVAAAATLRIDRTEPGNGAPRAGFATKKALLGSKLPVRASWSTGTDTGGAGVWKYEVAKTTDGGAHWTSLGATQKQSLDYFASASGTLQFRLRAIDWAGNRGPWIKGSVQTPRLVQQIELARALQQRLDDPRVAGVLRRFGQAVG